MQPSSDYHHNVPHRDNKVDSEEQVLSKRIFDVAEDQEYGSSKDQTRYSLAIEQTKQTCLPINSVEVNTNSDEQIVEHN